MAENKRGVPKDKIKILGISASPRREKSQTLVLLKEALSAAGNEGAYSELVQLPELEIEFCRACEHCHKKKGCIIEDDCIGLLDKFLESDGFILASPVYIRQVTASLKAVMDRSSHFIHCQRLLGKYAGCIVTSGGGMGEEVLNFVRDYVITCGAQYVGGVSAKAPVSQSTKEESIALAQNLIKAVKEGRQYSEQISKIKNFREFFKSIIRARKDEWRQEFEYWQERGWI